MRRPLQITFRGIGPSEAVERRVRAEFERLERLSDEITSGHVTVEAVQRSHHQGNLYAVRLALHVPGREIVVGRDRERDQAHQDVYVAIRDAFAAAARQLDHYASERRREVKRHAVPPHGRVTRVYGQEGYGFVQVEGGPEVYFHQNAVTDGTFQKLRCGDEVRVVMAAANGSQGPRASSVTSIGKHHLVRDPRAEER